MRLIDADALIERIKYSFYDHERVRIDAVTGTFLTEFCSPTVEAEPVVRCKDCKYRRDDDDYVSGHYCVKRPSNGGHFCENNDFCSYGERRASDDNIQSKLC